MRFNVLPFLLLPLFTTGLQAQLFTQVTNSTVVTANAPSTGCSWADFNNDGHPDLFVANSNNSNNQLFKNNGDDTFTEINVGPIVSDGGISNAAIWGDYNNDGNLDVFISNNPPVNSNPQLNFLYKNNGAPDFDFTKIQMPGTQTDANYTWSSSWVDFDNDGDLDLHMPDNKHLRTDFFYENMGDETFTSISPSFVSPDVESTGVVSWIDYDHDGDQDLFMIKSGRSHPDGREDNRMYHNNLMETGNLDFQRVYTSDMVNHFDLDFQASWGDYDNDGDMDVYLGNFDNANYLYRNEGDSLFTQISSGIPVTDNNRTLGSTWGDFDNDGDLDLYVLNTSGQKSKYYRNDGQGNFSSLNASAVGAPLNNISNGQACATADYNNDGYLDLYVANNFFSGSNNAQNYLYANNGGTNNFMVITCKGTVSNAAAFGTKIWLKATVNGSPLWQLRHITGNPTGNHAQNDGRVHFGLGNATEVDSLLIEWPLGLKEIYTQLPSNQFLTYVEGEVTALAETVEVPPVLNIFPNPFKGQTSIRYQNDDAAEKIQLLVLDETQKTVAIVYEGTAKKGLHEFHLDSSTWASGIYFLLLKKEGQIYARKLISVR